jgi:hypothetical protein
MRSREKLFPAEAKIESFLTDLAVHANVAPATQTQLGFLGMVEDYRKGKGGFSLRCLKNYGRTRNS